MVVKESSVSLNEFGKMGDVSWRITTCSTILNQKSPTNDTCYENAIHWLTSHSLDVDALVQSR